MLTCQAWIADLTRLACAMREQKGGSDRIPVAQKCWKFRFAGIEMHIFIVFAFCGSSMRWDTLGSKRSSVQTLAIKLTDPQIEPTFYHTKKVPRINLNDLKKEACRLARLILK